MSSTHSSLKRQYNDINSSTQSGVHKNHRDEIEIKSGGEAQQVKITTEPFTQNIETLTSIVDSFKTLKNDNDHLQAKVNELEAQLDVVQKDNNKNKKKAEKLDKALKGMEKCKNSLALKLETVEMESAGLEEELKLCEKDTNNAKSKLEDLKDQIGDVLCGF